MDRRLYSDGGTRRLRSRRRKAPPLLPRVFFSPLYFVITFVYIECVFHIAEFHNLSLFFPILFAIPVGILFGMICDLFPENVAAVLRYALSLPVMLIFSVQVVYFHSFQSFMSMGQLGMGDDVFKNFFKTILLAVWECLPVIILIFLPTALLVIGKKYLHPANKTNPRLSITLLVVFVVTQFFAVMTLPVLGTGEHSANTIYHANELILDLSVEKLGLLTTTRHDIQFLMLGTPENPDTDPDVPVIINPPVDPSIVGTEAPTPGTSGETGGLETGGPDVPPKPESIYNVIEGLDFASLAEKETDKTVKLVFEYLAALTPTKKNEYTGMFKDYNLILICAESFSPAAIDKTLTPTLYKLSTSGFIFENYWTTYPSNTTNGEYSLLTGLIPDLTKPKKDGSFVFSAKNTMNQNIGSFFNALGLTTRAYHDHTSDYYSRNITHPNLGYVFKGREQIGGLSGWPESDLTMMKNTIPDYINDERFHTYYMTVSMHHNYRFGGFNSIADKNRDLVSSISKSEPCQAYMACAIELDRALEYLISQLEAAGKLDKTVICLSTDHYPYGLTDKEYREANDSKTMYDGLYRYQSSLILWNSAMEPVTVTKPCCPVDVLPTLLNLFGFEYDSRLYSGTDILSDSAGLAMTTNQSFVTDKIVYNSRYEKVYKLDKSWEMPDGYLETYIQIVKNRFSIASNILNYDLYSKLK